METTKRTTVEEAAAELARVMLLGHETHDTNDRPRLAEALVEYASAIVGTVLRSCHVHEMDGRGVRRIVHQEFTALARELQAGITEGRAR